ncbi:MAG: hypothetical protein KIS66_13830 [Fimbriimonadaceae bacterium]|nr:hypothetical protein [Fimbriimonadaceae bacterium]
MAFSSRSGPAAGGASSWDAITGKPATYPPTLPIATEGVAGLADALAGKAASSHTHLQSQVTALEADLAGRFRLHLAQGRDPVALVSGCGASATGLTVTVTEGAYVDEDGTLVSVPETALDLAGEADGDYLVLVHGGTVGYEPWAQQLPQPEDLPLYVATKSGGAVATLYGCANRLTTPSSLGRTPFLGKPYVRLCKVASGNYANAIRTDKVGGHDPYFEMLGLWSLADREPAMVQAALDRALSMFNTTTVVPAAYVTGGGSKTFQDVYGVARTAEARWFWRSRSADPYDDAYPSPWTIVAPDSCDSYAAVLIRTAVRLARRGGAYAAWWDANWAALSDILYYNVLIPMANTGGGYLTRVFQTESVYPYCLVGDNCEVLRGLLDFSNWVTAHGNGTQTAWLTTNAVAGAIENLKNGLDDAWDGDGDFLNWFYRIAAPNAGWGGNDHLTFYPEIWVYLMPLLFRVPLYNGSADAKTLHNERMRRMRVCLDRIAAHAPWAGRSGRYGGVFPYAAMFAAAFASAGMVGEARRCLEFFLEHHVRDGDLVFATVADVGWALYAQDCLSGANPDAMGEWFE